MLLDAKADVNAKRWSGDTPLMGAINSGNLALVKLLLDRDAEINVAESRMGQTPLMWAVAEGRSEIAALLIERGADVNVVSQHGYNALLFAALKGDAGTLKKLIAAKADPKFRAPDGGTAFTIALGRGNEEVARLMLELRRGRQHQGQDRLDSAARGRPAGQRSNWCATWSSAEPT